MQKGIVANAVVLATSNIDKINFGINISIIQGFGQGFGDRTFSTRGVAINGDDDLIHVQLECEH